MAMFNMVISFINWVTIVLKFSIIYQFLKTWMEFAGDCEYCQYSHESDGEISTQFVVQSMGKKWLR